MPRVPRLLLHRRRHLHCAVVRRRRHHHHHRRHHHHHRHRRRRLILITTVIFQLGTRTVRTVLSLRSLLHARKKQCFARSWPWESSVGATSRRFPAGTLRLGR
jgi:hypothetical protein